MPEFYANGVLVHNCTRYLVNELPEPLPPPPDPRHDPYAEHWKRVREAEEDGPRDYSEDV